jgi:hypothetical protein
VTGALLMGPIAYPSGQGALQVAGYAPVALGSVPAALALARSGRAATGDS